MRRRPALRESRLAHVAVGASMLAIPASAAAFADKSRDPASATTQTDADQAGTIEATVQSRRIAYGRDAVLSGRVSSQAGRQVALEFAPAGTSSWRQISTARVRRDGRFRVAAPLRRSGAVRVTVESPSSTTPTVPIAFGATDATAAAPSSAPQRIAVAARIRVHSGAVDLFRAGRFTVRGRLEPAGGGRRVRLQARLGHRWHTLAGGRTSTRGAFALRSTSPSSGRTALRVRFGGDGANAPAASRTEVLSVFSQSVASWYNDGGHTACGFHAQYGVANVSLPCGTRVTFMNGGRSVTATVDDRGPYVGGREWDLNQNTAAALGFGGVGTVWASY